jgi:Pyridoxamine 5'-phosphate oxidase
MDGLDLPRDESRERREEPRASRPHFPPGYGVQETEEGLIPWSWAREKLEQALGYWLVTIRRDGRPHAIPTWGAWVDDRFYCEGSPETVYARNIGRDPRVVLNLESVDEVVVVEGEARLITEIPDELRDRVLPGWTKYVQGKDYKVDPSGWPGALFEIRPLRARGWRRLEEASRWTWED